MELHTTIQGENPKSFLTFNILLTFYLIFQMDNDLVFEDDQTTNILGNENPPDRSMSALFGFVQGSFKRIKRSLWSLLRDEEPVITFTEAPIPTMSSSSKPILLG